MDSGGVLQSVGPASRRGIGSYSREGLLLASAALMGVTLYLIYLWAPTEQNLGISQRIFYFHVPLAWIGMLSMVVVAVASVLYLATGRDRWDSLAYATAELGVVFASLILVTGVIWAKGDLGWWWTWDAKLTTTLILWFIYVGYLMIRSYAPAGSQGARYGAIVAVIGAIDAPIIYVATCVVEHGPSGAQHRALGRRVRRPGLRQNLRHPACLGGNLHRTLRVPAGGEVLAETNRGVP